MIGAGSTVFAKALMVDILQRERLRETEFALMDIDEGRLETTERLAKRLNDQLGGGARLEATTDRAKALEGADYVVCMVQVGGYKPGTVVDFEVPKRFGLRQTIADTLGIGGIFRALRTIPVTNGIAHDMERLCPKATLLNYTNPMAMLCWAMSRATSVRSIGLCHSVQGTARHLAQVLGLDPEGVDYLCAGINHMAFYLRLEHGGQDMYPALREVAESGNAPPNDRVRFEMLRWLGYFVTESSEHFSEYCPWFIRNDRPELIERFGIPLDEYIRRCEVQIAGWERLREELLGGAALDTRPSIEYGSAIIEAMEGGEPVTVYGNVANEGLVSNLPDGCCVEVPCAVATDSLVPQAVGALPPQLAALIQTNVNVQALTVEAALTGRREHVYHAAMLDPHTSQTLALDDIRALVDALFEAHEGWIPPMH
jgi:alpha-galactosidase